MHPPTVMAVPGLSSCTDQDVKPPTFLDTGLAWCQAKTQWPRFKEIRHINLFFIIIIFVLLYLFYFYSIIVCDIVIYISIYIDLVRKHWRCRCRCRWLSNPHSSWFENGLHAWIISLIWNLFVWFLWNQMKQFLKYDFSANLHYFWSNFFVCLLARYVAVGFLIINFVHTCFLKPSLLLKALCIVIMAKHMVLLLQTLLDCWHCLLSIHQPVSSSSLVWKGSTRIFFSKCFASSSEREMVGPKIYCSYQCHRMGKLAHLKNVLGQAKGHLQPLQEDMPLLGKQEMPTYLIRWKVQTCPCTCKG